MGEGLLLKLLNDGRELKPENVSKAASRIGFNLGIQRILSCQRQNIYKFGQQ